ncbi:MAG: hypothetical protein HOE90_02335 [Bacteriovoracaceae bacterium]|jgi:hypothetical protein|nr:hypothetical protein [Bacteriovoracaceae bacterium]
MGRADDLIESIGSLLSKKEFDSVKLELRELKKLPRTTNVKDGLFRLVLHLGSNRGGGLVKALKYINTNPDLSATYNTKTENGRDIFLLIKSYTLLGAWGYTRRLIEHFEPIAHEEIVFIASFFWFSGEFDRAVEMLDEVWLKKDEVENPMQLLRYSMILISQKDYSKCEEVMCYLKKYDFFREGLKIQYLRLYNATEQWQKLVDLGNTILDSEKIGYGTSEYYCTKAYQAISWYHLKLEDECDACVNEVLSGFKGGIFERLSFFYQFNSIGKLPDIEKFTLHNYPGSKLAFELKTEMKLSPGFEGATIKFFPHSDEVCIDGIFHHPIPQELKLLQYVYQAGDVGVSLINLSNILWPDGIFTIESNVRRIYSMCTRLKNKYSLDLSQVRHLLLLEGNLFSHVGIDFSAEYALQIFKKHSEFKKKDFAAFYGISEISAHRKIKSLLEKGLLDHKIQGREKVYFSC